MATLATQSIVRTGTIPTYGAAAGGGDKMTPGTGAFLHAKNASGGSITVTIAVAAGDPGTGLVIADLAVAIAAGAEKMIGPIPAQYFADPTDGLAAITYSGVTSLTVASLNLGQP